MQIQEFTTEQIHATVAAAALAADNWARSSAPTRAALLCALASILEANRDTLVTLADSETSLGQARLNGELDRTTFQLRGFAQYVLTGHAFALTDDPAVSAPPPVGHPRLTRVRMPVGPVAMFSASNFPLAFSVLGGDTAAALAAGCPVVVKAHPGHPGLSRAIHALAQSALRQQGLPDGLLGMVEGAGVEVGVALVRHPDIAAVAFTGSFKGGTALQAVANQRPRPIPFYGELGSINPVVAMPAALASQAEELAHTLASSIGFGSGQVCTSPGLLVLQAGPEADRFEQALQQALQAVSTHPMLTTGMKQLFDAAVSRLLSTPGVETILAGAYAADEYSAPRPVLAATSAQLFVSQPALHEEIFGPACLLVRAQSADDIVQVLRAVGGSLTVTLWGLEHDSDEARHITRCAMQIAGRVLFSGVPTGVAVVTSQQHGGPWPASTQPFTTSVGYAAMDRFLRPVALQSAPTWLADCAGRPC